MAVQRQAVDAERERQQVQVLSFGFQCGTEAGAGRWSAAALFPVLTAATSRPRHPERQVMFEVRGADTPVMVVFGTARLSTTGSS
jgi:hypothetical protein